MAPHPEMSPLEAALSPMAVRDMSVAKTLLKRTDSTYLQLAQAGARKPDSLKGPGFQILFALIGVGMTLTAIWFFFWAKNGGFKWRKHDWEDYKTTVMRRKGPDGRTLSNATKSTRLGGGSVVHGGSYGAESSVGYTDETATSADVSEYRDAEEGKRGLRGGESRAHRDKNDRRSHTNDYTDPELRNYRHEKPARVGGLNRQADGMYTDYSGSQPSELGSHVSSAPLVNKVDKAEKKDPKKEAKAKEMRARERMKKAKAAEKEAARVAAAEAKARKEEQKAEAKRVKDAQKKAKKTKSEAAPSVAPEMAEVTRPLTDYTGPAYTEYTAPSEAGTPEKTRTAHHHASKPRRVPSTAYSFTTGEDDNATVYTGAYTDTSPNQQRTTPRAPPSAARSNDVESSYYSDYRPNADPSAFKPRPRPQGSRSRPPSQSPTKRPRPQSTARPSHAQYAAAPSDSDIFTATNGEAQGHMSYPCHIPGLSSAGSVGVSESVSQVGAQSARRGRDVMDGYRRGGVRIVGRRNSLSDSD